MTCGLPEGVEIEFPNSGVRIQPKEVDMRFERRNYANAQFVLTEEAAQLVSARVPNSSPAFLKFNGHVSRRLMRSDNAIEWRDNLEDITVADMELHDPRKVLRRGTISRSWDSVLLEDAVEYIFDNVNDPHNVITGYQFVTPGLAEENRLSPPDWPSPFGVLDVVNDINDAIVRTIEDTFRNFDLVGGERATGSVEFENISPLEAMEQLMDMFEADWWIDNDGVVKIGFDVTYGQVIGTVAGDDSIKLSRYSIARSEEVTRTVQIRGPYRLDLEESFIQGPLRRLQVIGEATDTAQEGGEVVALESQKPFESPREIERAAYRTLMRNQMDEVEGSLTINALASELKQELAQLDVGDVLYIDESIQERCDKQVATGAYIINSISHIASPRRGWNINVRLSSFPVPDDIQVRSVFYDPIADKSYDDLEAAL